MNHLIAAAALFAALVFAPRVEAGCTLSSTGVAFGTYNPLAGGPLDSAGSLSYACTPDVGGTLILLSQGNSGSYAARHLARAGSTDVLLYNLYLDAARSQIWGDGFTGGSRLYFVSAAAGTHAVPVYGRVTAAQDVPVGAYSDLITATMFF